MGGDIPSGNFLGGNFPGGSLMGGNFPGVNFPGRNFPRTKETNRLLDKGMSNIYIKVTIEKN